MNKLKNITIIILIYFLSSCNHPEEKFNLDENYLTTRRHLEDPDPYTYLLGNGEKVLHYYSSKNDGGEINERINTDIKLFQKFVDLVPKEFREDIRTFKSDESGLGTMMTRTFGSFEGGFILTLPSPYTYEGRRIQSLRNEESLGYPYLTKMMVHELGHYITLNRDQIEYDEKLKIINKPGSFMEDIKSISWNSINFEKFEEKRLEIISLAQEEKISFEESFKRLGELKKELDELKEKKGYIKSNRTIYVSDYAASDISEDAAESFTHFILRKTLPIESLNNTEAEKKILVFAKSWRMRELRRILREQIVSLGLN